MMKAILWIVLNFGLTYCAVMGAVLGSKPCENVLIFATWSLFVISLLVAAADKETKATIAIKGRSVPAWLSIGNDIIIISILASAGWFWMAGAILFSTAIESSIYDTEY